MPNTPDRAVVSFTQPSSRLAAAREVIEGKFLELGQGLETAVTLVGGQISALEALTSSFSAESAEEAAANLSDAAAQLNSLGLERGGDVSRFQELARAGRLLGEHIEAMQQALRYLHVFAVNIKVTAGGVPGAYEIFEDFAEEVLAAIAAGKEQLVEFSRELDELGGEVATAVTLEGELERRCASLLPAVPRQLAADAATLADHHKRVVVVATETRDVARSLQGRVAGVLSGLQIGDTTRQRVEHVETALEILARARQATLDEGGSALILGMLKAQLEDTAEIFNRDVEKMTAHLAGVSAEAQQVLRLRDEARGAGGRGEQTGVLERLEARLADAISLIGDLESAEQATRDVGHTARNTAERLGRRIESIRAIKTSINHMALNAHLKCCRLGEAGRPLSVIAVELRVSGEHLGDRAVAAETILATMGAEVHLETAADDQPDARAVGALLQAAVSPVRDADRKARAGLEDFGGQCQTVASALRQATDRLNFRGEVSEVLVQVARELGTGSETVAPSPGLAAAMEEIARHYTMAREREIHRRFQPVEAEAEAA